MTGLAIDTSGDLLSVALAHGNETHAIEVDAGLRHSERLLELVDSVSSLSRIDRKELDFIACMKGPGSFTGLRIGMATAKGIATALGIPLFAVPTLECFAAARSIWPGSVLPLIDAKKNRWYTAVFNNGSRICEDMDASAEEIAVFLRKSGKSPILVCGTDAPRAINCLTPLVPELRFVLDPSHRRGAALELACIARSRAERGDTGEADGIGLEYLRKSEAELTREAKTRGT